MTNPNIIFREITTPEELLPFLRLRYRLFRDSDDKFLNMVVSENPEALDVDGYDLRSWHLGLFHRDVQGGKEEAVGYTRLILEADTHFITQSNLADVLPVQAQKLATAPKASWLTLEKVPDLKTPVRMFAEEAGRLGCQHVVEVSRTCLDDSVRTYPVTRWLYRCLMAFGLVHKGAGAAFTASPPSVGAMNKRFGLRHQLDFEWLGKPMGLYTITRFDLPNGPNAWVAPMVQAYTQQGYLRFEG